MKGHIRERSPGRWAIILDVRDSRDGQAQAQVASFDGTKREAQKECARLIAEMDGGAYVEPAKTTLAAFLDRWLEHMASQVAPRTHERYDEIARKNIVPLLGGAVADEAPAGADLRRLRQGARQRPSGRQGRALAPDRAPHAPHLAAGAGQAVRWGILARNPADAVKPPKVERKKMRALDAAETARLLEAFPADPHVRAGPARRALRPAPRRGDGLEWGAVDLDGGAARRSPRARSRRAPASGRRRPRAAGPRTVALPSLAVEELRRHRVRQAEELLRLGVRLTDETHVFAQADGAPIQPNSLTHEFVRILALAPALPRIRFHDLRHSHATHLLANGVHPKIAQERLGHSSVGITLDLYSHVMPGMQEDAAAKVDAALRAAIDKAAN